MTNKQLMQMVEDIIGKRVANLTVQQFADITGLSPRTIRQDCASGRLPAFQISVGRPYLIHYTQLTRYMEVNRAAWPDVSRPSRRCLQAPFALG